MRTLLTLAVFATLCTPALAADRCVIVFAKDQPSWKEIYWHEMAHCNGWTHPEKAPPKNGENYQSYVPPKRYVHLPSIEVETRAVTTAEAKKLCDGHWGCQRFE